MQVRPLPSPPNTMNIQAKDYKLQEIVLNLLMDVQVEVLSTYCKLDNLQMTHLNDYEVMLEWDNKKGKQKVDRYVERMSGMKTQIEKVHNSCLIYNLSHIEEM